jgi:hypothetical protein
MVRGGVKARVLRCTRHGTAPINPSETFRAAKNNEIRQFGEYSTQRLELEAVIEAEWQSAKENASANRTIFAQRSLKPEQALREWDRTRESLGSAEAVERLVLNACRRLNLPIGPLRGSQGGAAGEGDRVASGWELDLTRLEDNRQALRERLRNHDLDGKLRLSFRPAAREGSQLQGCQLLSRSHPLVVELADFVAEQALSGLEPELAARASVIRTKAVSRRTQLLVLRLRLDFLPVVNGGDSFYAAHGDASAIGWVGASQPAATARVDLCAAPRPF